MTGSICCVQLWLDVFIIILNDCGNPLKTRSVSFFDEELDTAKYLAKIRLAVLQSRFKPSSLFCEMWHNLSFQQDAEAGLSASQPGLHGDPLSPKNKARPVRWLSGEFADRHEGLSWSLGCKCWEERTNSQRELSFDLYTQAAASASPRTQRP